MDNNNINLMDNNKIFQTIHRSVLILSLVACYILLFFNYFKKSTRKIWLIKNYII